jgi:hypothetical protein
MDDIAIRPNTHKFINCSRNMARIQLSWQVLDLEFSEAVGTRCSRIQAFRDANGTNYPLESPFGTISDYRKMPLTDRQALQFADSISDL